MKRVIERELLDDLPAGDVKATQARLDLRRVNWWMRNSRIVAQSLLTEGGRIPPEHIADLGAGDGYFFATLARWLPSAWRCARLTLVDKNSVLAPDALKELVERGWNPEFIREDVMQWASTMLPGRRCVVVTNLFLHHFSEIQLTWLFQLLESSTDIMVACEPRRSVWASLAVHCLGLIGCGPVTRRDGSISVRAGFRGNELSVLWPDRTRWIARERWAWPFSHLLVVRRQPGAHERKSATA